MRRYLVVAHRTLGGSHLFDHLESLALEDPATEFHIVVPRYHPRNEIWSEGTTQEFAERHLDEMLTALSERDLDATGEVGTSKPVNAIAAALDAHGTDTFCGIVLSTLPRDVSSWWRGDVPRKVEKQFPALPLTHLVAEAPATA